jgi:hypothetical protein
MDPTIEALTIQPAAWAALFRGLAEGIAYGLAVAASVAIGVGAVLDWLGGRGRSEVTLDGLASTAVEGASTLWRPGVDPRRQPGIVTVVWSQRQARTTRRRPRPGCRRLA